MLFSHVKISPLLWLHNKSGLSQEKNCFIEMVWHFIGVYTINRTLHGRLEIRNFSFQHSKRNFVSPRGHVISTMYVLVKTKFLFLLHYCTFSNLVKTRWILETQVEVKEEHFSFHLTLQIAPSHMSLVPTNRL